MKEVLYEFDIKKLYTLLTKVDPKSEDVIIPDTSEVQVVQVVQVDQVDQPLPNIADAPTQSCTQQSLDSDIVSHDGNQDENYDVVPETFNSSPSLGLGL